MPDMPDCTPAVSEDPNRSRVDQLLTKIEKAHPGDNVALVEKAYEFARAAHADQKRRSGEPYIVHPLSVAETLADLSMDATTISAGLLHDCVEDIEEITVETIEQ